MINKQKGMGLGKNTRMIMNKIIIFILFLSLGYYVQAQESIIAKDKVRFEEIRSKAGFIHPGIGCTVETLNNLRDGVLNGQSPWVDYFAGLRRSKYAGLDSQMHKCERILNNGGIGAFADDAQLAWTQAILYVVTGNEAYRRIPQELIKWYGSRDDFFPRAFPDSHIKLGKYVYVFCAAAEIMRYTLPVDKELAVTANMLTDFEQNCIRPIRRTILENKGYFMNQHTYALVGYVAGAILADDREGYEDAVEMTTVNKDAPNQGFNGAIKAVCRLIDKDAVTGELIKPYVQLIEMGRDEAHAFGNVDNLNLITRMIDLQGTKVDPVSGRVTEHTNGVRSSSFLNDRLLEAAEYFSRFNMGYGIKWTPVFSSLGVNPKIYKNISPEYRGRVDMNGYPAFFYWFRGLGYDLEKYPALKISALKAIKSQRNRVGTGEFINTLHNYNFDFFIGLPKAAAIGTPDLQKAQKVLAVNMGNYTMSPKGVRQVEDLYVDLSAIKIPGTFYPHSNNDIPLEVKKEQERTFVRMCLQNGVPRTMVNLEGSMSCPVGKTGILIRSDAPVRIDLHNGEDYQKKHPVLSSIYVPDTNGEWRYVIFERDPKVITNSMFGFSSLLYFNVHPMEENATVDFDLFNSNKEDIQPIELNVRSGMDRLFVCLGQTIEKKYQNLSDDSRQTCRFWAQGLPEGASFNRETGLLSWKPKTKDLGLHKVYVAVQNGISTSMIPVEIFVGKNKDEVVNRITQPYDLATKDYVACGKEQVASALKEVKEARQGNVMKAFSRLQAAVSSLQLLNPWLLGEEGSLDYTKTSISSKGLNIFVYSNGDNYDCAGIFGPHKEFVLDFGEKFKVKVDSFGLQSRANFPDRVKETIILGSNDSKNWNLLTQYPAGVDEDMQVIPVKADERKNSYRYLKVHMPNKKGTPGLLDLSEFRIYGRRLEMLPVQPDSWTVDVRRVGAEINKDMYGVFFEDINFGADGGLYAELVKNRSFEFPHNPLNCWMTFGCVTAETENPSFIRCPHYIRLNTLKSGLHGCGLINEGFRDIGVKAGEKYIFSAWIRHREGQKLSLRVHIQDKMKHERIAAKDFELPLDTKEWTKISFSMEAAKTNAHCRLRIELLGRGELDMDHISLFPENTWLKRPGGLREDLVQTLADLKPGVFRFPGGCIVEGDNLENRYQWKNSVGPVENRPINETRWARWGGNDDYYQSLGLGFYEYFQLAEDLGAEPLPVLSVGMACQFVSNQRAQGEPLDEFIQDCVDLVEFANGDTTTYWGKIRAEMGHPAPFKMKYLGIGNEQWGRGYVENLSRFLTVMRNKCPDIQIVGGSGPGPNGEKFDYLWPEMKRLKVDLVDEHYYQSPEWFFSNARRYDTYDRKGPKVFAGEYASHDRVNGNKPNSFLAALSEAAFMTGLERNADIVHLTAYAPLFAHVNAVQWNPDLIWFDNLRVMKTPSYYVQQLYSLYKGTHVLSLLDADKQPIAGSDSLYASAVVDRERNNVIIKVVNANQDERLVDIQLKGLSGDAKRIVNVQLLSAALSTVNTLEQPENIKPQSDTFSLSGTSLALNLKGQSFQVITVPL